MESRKMILMNLFAGSSGDTENRLVDTVGKERMGQIERVAWKHIQYCI